MSGGAPCGCGQAACGCCEGIRALTPLLTWNRPGLDALAVRIGTHGSFLATMKARLSTHAFGDGETATRPLAGLGVRDADASIALLDAFATAADVLTFYQERIVNEAYLRTATEMRSLHELARLVGYQPRPGVAASAWLAYTLDANITEKVVIAAGSQVRTVPGPGETPQIFETSEDLEAWSAWSLLGVRKTEPARWMPEARSHELYLAGTATRLKPGDPLLVALGDAIPEAYRIIEVEEDPDAERTRVALERWAGAPPEPGGLPVAIIAPLRRIRALRDAPPTGKTAAAIVELIEDIEEPGQNTEITHAELAAAVPLLIALRRQIRDRIAALRNPAQATRLVAWAGELDKAFGELIRAVEDHVEPPPPECDVEALIGRLAIPPAVPAASPLQLPASFDTRFEEAGDAGLAMLAQASPDFADNLAAGLAGCRAEDEKVPPIRVYALRLRAHLFGHNVPKQKVTVTTLGPGQGTPAQPQQTIATTEIGEWPIVSHDPQDRNAFIKREARDRLDLDGSHDGILPRSWLLADMTGVPDFAGPLNAAPRVAVARAGPWRVAQVRSAQANTTRADYGAAGEITRLFIEAPDEEDGWIRVARDDLLDNLISPPIADKDFQVVRGTTVYAASEQLEVAPSPIAEPVCDGSAANAPIELDGLYLGIEPGRYVIVTGDRADIEHVEGVSAVEPAMIAAVVHDVRADLPIAIPWTRTGGMADPDATETVAAHSLLAAAGAPAGINVAVGHQGHGTRDKLAGDTIHTFIWLEKPLSYCYRRDTIAIRANVVKATHGESHEEILGSGDGSRPNQSFALKHKPLTWLPAATPAGAADTLQIFVNDIEWREAASFVDQPPTARIHAVRTDHEAVSTVIFGDGSEGARLPTGTLNVTAVYRSGLGAAGNARAGQIQQLVTRPLGVKEVVNPARASGGADAETLDQIRRNAPLATAALGRLVATRDYADFARTFAGIAKAEALEISDGSRNLVHVTVAGLNDAPLDPGTELLVQLRKAYRDLGDPFQAVRVAPRELRLLVVEARLRIDPDRRWEVVAAAVREALLDRFGFERRDLGQGLASSEILNVIQSIEGVAMVDLDLFGAIPTCTAGADGVRRPLTPAETESAIKALVTHSRARGVARKVDARLARLEGGALLPAELLLLSRDVAATLVINQAGDQG